MLFHQEADKEFKKKKSPDSEGLMAENINNADPIIVEVLKSLINTILDTHIIPEKFKTGL